MFTFSTIIIIVFRYLLHITIMLLLHRQHLYWLSPGVKNLTQEGLGQTQLRTMIQFKFHSSIVI